MKKILGNPWRVALQAKEAELEQLARPQLSGDELARAITERARKILADEPVPSARMRIGFFCDR